MKICRMIKTLARKTSMYRNQIAKVSTKDLTIGKVQRIRDTGKHKKKLSGFFRVAAEKFG